ncbi:MAG: sulfotransferase, partial [Thalassobaculaceae bacterium]
EVFPRFHFIHVIRDGRDMATAGNQLQRDKHASALFGADDGDPRVTAARLWAKANGEASDWAARWMPGRYHPVIFENLCQAPEIEIGRLFVALDLPMSRVALAARLIDRPNSIGRWQRLDARTQNTVDGVIAVARQRFGFASAAPTGEK